jgi:UDP-N-acetylmuramate--alanine ligase
MTLPATEFDPGASVHFVGVGGAGMCALAEAMARGGLRVTGSDAAPGPSVDALRALGIPVRSGHDPAAVEGADVVVATAAVGPENPEIRRARERGIPVIKRAEALGRWVAHGRVVAVAGTHGKTSTTAMTTQVLAAAALEPTGLVGGTVRSWGGNLHLGGNDLFVVEADEFDRSFLHLSPDVAVVTNVEPDHLDTYGSLDAVREAFHLFLERCREDAAIVACGDDAGAGRLVQAFGNVVTYGTNAGSQIRATGVHTEGRTTRFDVADHGRGRGRFTLHAPGMHNVRNALAAAGAARALGVEWAQIREGLSAYEGVGRRFDRLGEPRGITVVDDYAHHPTEVRATLAAARAAYPNRRIVAVFQPHLFTRTRDFHSEFGRELSAADRVWVTAIYPAREEPIAGITADLVVEGIRRCGHSDTRYHADIETLPEALASTLEPGDVCLTLGAGSIERLGPALLEVLEEGS